MGRKTRSHCGILQTNKNQGITKPTTRGEGSRATSAYVPWVLALMQSQSPNFLELTISQGVLA